MRTRYTSTSDRKGSVAARRTLAGAAALLFAVACAHTPGSGDPQAKLVPATLYPQVTKKEGSIWPGESANNMLFEDYRAKRVGDIVTILISESDISSQTANTKTAKTTSLGLTTSKLLGLPLNLGIQNFLGMGAPLDPNLTASTNKSNTGSGTTSRQDSLTGTISAVVKEVLPNGYLRIEGQKNVNVNEEDQTLMVKGLIRPADITYNNTVPSANIANAEITFLGKGVVGDEQKAGWGTKIINWVWPF